MTAKRLSSPTIGAILSSGVALWASCGALAFADDGSRIGVLPSAWWLPVAWAATCAAAVVAGRRAVVLWLAAVLLLPWLPLPVPDAALVWIGPLRWWIWLAIAATIVLPAIARSSPAPVRALFVEPRRAAITAGAIAACVYLATAWQIAPQLPAGDEPHYLVIAQSLLIDHDLQIANNHDRGDYRAYFDAPLKPHYLALGKNGQIYSVHAPGVAAIVAPAFAVAGYPGVLAFLALVSGVGAALAWRAAFLVAADAAAAWFGWAAVTLSVPFLFEAFTVYPDGIAATIVVATMLVAMRSDRPSTATLVATGAALALLPWLHTRFAITAAALGVVVAAREIGRADRWRRIAAFAAVPAIGAVAWFGFFYTIYGTPNPTAPYGGYTQSSVANVPRGLLGLLVDQQFGILVGAPVYLCVLAGLVPLARRAPRAAALVLTAVVPYTITAAFYYMWWGGYAAPARFLASILLPLSMPAAAWYAASRPAMRAGGLAALGTSLLVSAVTAGVNRGALLYNVRDGAAKVLRWASPIVDVTSGMPSLFQTSPTGALGRAAIWLIAAGAVAAAARWLDRRAADGATALTALGLTAACTAMAALSAVWTLNAAQPRTAAVAAPRLLRSIDVDAHQIGLRFDPFRRVRVADVPPLVPLATSLMPLRRADDPLVAIAEPPAAIYTIEATVTGDADRLTAGIDRQPGPLWSWDLSGVRGRWRGTLTLPNDARALRFDGTLQTRAALRDILVRAERRLGAHERVSDQRAWRGARYTGATIFLLDGRAYVEPDGSWIPGGGSAEFGIVGDGGAPVQLFVRNSAVANTVRLESTNWRQQLSLAPREERLFAVPPSADRPGVVVKVSSASGARPSDVEPGNGDRRLLGCWIETR